MRNDNSTDGRTSQDNKVYQNLRVINELIKGSKTRAEGFQNLEDIDFDELSGGLKMYYRYLKGKYYSKMYKASTSKDVEWLERANDQFDEIARIAYEHGIKPRKQQYLFMRIHTKYLLSKIHKGELAQRFLDHAKSLSSHAMEKYSDNSGSFTWLHNEMNGH